MPTKVHQDEFAVVGIEARTTNAKEMSGAGVIATQWTKFFQDGIQAKIPDKIDDKIYALYTDYASDRNGEYTFVIGARVKPTSKAPTGMVRRIVGTLLLVGQNRMNLSEFAAIVQRADKTHPGSAVPSRGLCLLQVTYPEECGI